MESSQPCADQQVPDTLGFYSVLELESLGFCGGYLILNQLARPLEFHCTLPILPQRAQQILYGPSLRPYLVAEHIGPPLIAKSRLRPDIILVDEAAALRIAPQVSLPVVLVRTDDHGGLRLETGSSGNIPFEQWLGASSPAGLDMLEPFERIREAIEEAHAVAR